MPKQSTASERVNESLEPCRGEVVSDTECSKTVSEKGAPSAVSVEATPQNLNSEEVL